MSSQANTSKPGGVIVLSNNSPEPQASACAIFGTRRRPPFVIALIATWALSTLTGCIPPPPIDGCTETLCDDDDACTQDTCRVIDGVPTCFITPVECNIGECDPETGECATSEDCDDGDPCTDDSFDEATGECEHGAIECPENLVCDPSTGECIPDLCMAVDCDDGNLCTIDSCDPVTGVCANEPVDCGGGPCDPEIGGCCDDCFECDDDDPCTDDSWDPATGECLNTEVVCEDDELFCNGVPKCNRLSGECESRAPCLFVGPCDEDTDSCVDPYDSEQCLSQCEPPFEQCDERPLEDFPAFEDALIEALELFQGYPCDGDVPWIGTARCPGGALDVIDLSFGEGRLTRFYDQHSGQYVAQRMWSDGADETCSGKSYWPTRVDCDTGIVSEVLCGTQWAVGDEISFR